MTPPESVGLRALVAAAKPFLRVTDVVRCAWCRPMQDPRDPRIGPWQYRAQFEVLDEHVWAATGEVLYFVTDEAEAVRLVGQSIGRLKTRWRTSPMYDVDTKAPLGTHALFHSTSWPAIEKGFARGERPPFVVSALFRPELEAVCRAHKVLAPVLAKPETHLQRLSCHVETWVCGIAHPRPLWNKAKVAGGHAAARPVAA